MPTIPYIIPRAAWLTSELKQEVVFCDRVFSVPRCYPYLDGVRPRRVDVSFASLAAANPHVSYTGALLSYHRVLIAGARTLLSVDRVVGGRQVIRTAATRGTTQSVWRRIDTRTSRRREVDERQVDALTARQFDSIWARHSAVAVLVGDSTRQVPVRLLDKGLLLDVAVRMRHRHDYNSSSSNNNRRPHLAS